jgi:hypothetical protein
MTKSMLTFLGLLVVEPGVYGASIGGFTTSGVADFTQNLFPGDSANFFNTTPAQANTPTTLTSMASTEFVEVGGEAHGMLTASMGHISLVAEARFRQDLSGSSSQTHVQINAMDESPVGGLPAGAPVELLVSFPVSGIHSLPDRMNGSYSAEVVGHYLVCDLVPNCLNLTYDSFHDPTSTVLQGILDTVAGTTLTVSYGLDGVTFAEGLLGGEGFVDYGDSARYFIDALTPGVTLTWESGHDYSTPASSVPELGSCFLFAGGIACMIARKRLLIKNGGRP